jgi:C-terminal processing protease CtpA/Prc
VLAGNIGYLDLDRLESGAADAAFELIRDTRALVVDLRGYPRLDDGFTFATRLGTATPLGFARLCVPLVAAEAGPTHLRRCDWSMHAAVSDPRPHYTHPVVVLINNGSQSYSEHLGLALEAYANATFVGTPSAGADGNISWVSLVGGAATSFGAMAATHFDGRQLQGVGLQPQVVVEPTLAGLRAGKDEVLERGVQEASKQAAAAH